MIDYRAKTSIYTSEFDSLKTCGQILGNLRSDIDKIEGERMRQARKFRENIYPITKQAHVYR